VIKRRAGKVAAWLLGIYLLGPASAFAEYLGSDPFVNIGPTQGLQGLAARYPLSNYGLDYHVDFGVTNPGGIVPELRQSFAQQGWDLICNGLNLIIEVFTWAFNLQLITGPHGALPAIAAAVQQFEGQVVAQGWLYFAVICAGVWGMWRALVQRRAGEVFAAFALSLACTVACIVIISNPTYIIGGAVKFANGVSTSFLNGFGAVGKKGDDPSTSITDHVFDIMIYKPWVVLEFGGLEHCVDTHLPSPQDDSYPLSVAPGNPFADVCRSSTTQDTNGYGGYAKFFLRQAPGTDARDEEYDALRRGEVPDDPKYAAQFRGRKIDKNDSAAVDIQQAGGALSRVRVVFLVGLGAIALMLLFGRLSVTVIIAQVVALALFGLAPIVLVAGIFPRGIDLVKWWATRLATALFIKIFYAIVIAVLMGVSAALLVSTQWAGFEVAFIIQTLFFWTVYLKRKLIVNELAKAAHGRSAGLGTGSAAITAAGMYAAMRPVRSMLRSSRTQRGNGTDAGPNAGKRNNDDITEDDDAVLDSGSTTRTTDPRWPEEPGDASKPGRNTAGGVRRGKRAGGKRGQREYRYATEEELAALNDGGGNGEKGNHRVAWALVGTEHDPNKRGVPQGGSATATDGTAPDDPTPADTREGGAQKEGRTPRELHDEAVGRLRRSKRKKRVLVESTHTEQDDRLDDDTDVEEDENVDES
jgi:hypothetical protein